MSEEQTRIPLVPFGLPEGYLEAAEEYWAGHPLDAPAPSPADPRLDYDLATLATIRSNRNLGATWTLIGRAQGKPPKIAKRDAKRLHHATRRAWYLHHNQDD